MSQTQYDASKSRPFVWLSLLITIIGGIIGFVAGQISQFRELELKIREADVKVQEAALKYVERDDRVHALKLDIVKQIQQSNFAIADAILIYLLKPIERDENNFEAFRSAMLALKSETAPKSNVLATVITTGSTDIIDDGAPIGGGSTDRLEPSLTAELIRREFSGIKRLNFRNELIKRYERNSDEVVSALAAAIVQKEESNSFRYRINLYIAFTLGGISGGWKGPPAVLNALTALKGTSEYIDSTFKARLDEAILNYKA